MKIRNTRAFFSHTLPLTLLAFLVAGTIWAGLPATDLKAATGTWTTTTSMSSPRMYHTITLLQNGKVEGVEITQQKQ